MEIGGDELNFLDITLIKKDGRLYSNWFRKPTSSGRFLNFHLNFTSNILSLIKKALLF